MQGTKFLALAFILFRACAKLSYVAIRIALSAHRHMRSKHEGRNTNAM